MPRLFRLLLLSAFVAVVAGCATPTQMGVRKTDDSVDTTKNSILLMTLRVNHPVKPNVTPFPRIVHIERPGAESKEDRFNFVVDQDARSIGPDGTEYLLRFSLAPGRYLLPAITGGGGFAIFPGFFQIPLVADLEVKPNSIAYIGHIDARTRERVDKEFLAGPRMPLIDQAATGWSTSTWEVMISDAYDSDVPRFRANFKALESATIERQVLPPFDRGKAQTWWDKN